MSYIIPLNWGQTEEQMKEILPKDVPFYTEYGRVTINSLTLSNFPGDCGALLMNGANTARKETIKLAVKLASHSGFSKIFATIVKKYSSDMERDLDIKTRFHGWRVVYKGKSNRTSTKDDIVLVRIIKDCAYKGYQSCSLSVQIPNYSFVKRSTVITRQQWV